MESQIIIGLAIIFLLVIIQYFWLRFSRPHIKRKQFRDYEEKTVMEKGREQIKQLLAQHIFPPIIRYK